MSATYGIERGTGAIWSSGRDGRSDYARVSHEAWSPLASQPDLTAAIDGDELRLGFERDFDGDYATMPVSVARRLGRWLLDYTPQDVDAASAGGRTARLQAQAWQQGYDKGHLDALTGRDTSNPYEKGHTARQTAKLIGHPVAEVQTVIDETKTTQKEHA